MGGANPRNGRLASPCSKRPDQGVRIRCGPAPVDSCRPPRYLDRRLIAEIGRPEWGVHGGPVWACAIASRDPARTRQDTVDHSQCIGGQTGKEPDARLFVSYPFRIPRVASHRFTDHRSRLGMNTVGAPGSCPSPKSVRYKYCPRPRFLSLSASPFPVLRFLSFTEVGSV
jgi:hypothetical protein